MAIHDQYMTNTSSGLRSDKNNYHLSHGQFYGEKTKKSQLKIWFFAYLFVPLHPINQNINNIMDDYPADNYDL